MTSNLETLDYDARCTFFFMDRNLTSARTTPTSTTSTARAQTSPDSIDTAAMRVAVIDAEIARLHSQLFNNHEAAAVLHRYGATSIDDVKAQKAALCDIISACSDAVVCH